MQRAAVLFLLPICPSQFEQQESTTSPGWRHCERRHGERSLTGRRASAAISTVSIPHSKRWQNVWRLWRSTGMWWSALSRGMVQSALVAMVNWSGWQGIADGLMTAIMKWFVQQGALRVCVNVAPENIRACRLYARFGAVPLHPHWMIWKDVSQPTLQSAIDRSC